MTGKKLRKTLLVWLCIITLTMPFVQGVFAASALTGNETGTVVLETTPYRQGGPESTGTDYNNYDETSYSYKVSDRNVLKIIQNGDTDYLDTFYCVNAERSFSVMGNGYNYKKAADDFTKLTDEEVEVWATSVGISTENFNSLVYLIQTLYAKKLDKNYKDSFIATAFAEKIADDAENNREPATTVARVKEYLTDDDIEVIQQWAIWYFTNGSNSSNEYYDEVYSKTNLPAVQVTKITGVDSETHVPTTATQDLEGLRNTYAGILYEYLINTAKAHSGAIENPEINCTSRQISLWTGVDDSENLQPVILITPKEEPKYDLALRKYIVSVNGEATTGRTPTPTAASLDELAAGSRTTAEYLGAKSPVSVKKGDRIVYEFRIYNEGEDSAKIEQIVDYLPEGLTVVNSSNSETNAKFNWDTTNPRAITTTTFVNEELVVSNEIDAFNKSTKTLDYVVAQVELEITGDLNEGTVLTNVAEILLDDSTTTNSDRDSSPESINPDDITNDWSGNTTNPEDLNRTDYPYKGIEDDDDFEKVVIEGKQFDLSLKKFISKVNDKAQDREPVVDVTPLNNNKNDATYTTTKTPIAVEAGDIVTFTLRVYNEGDIDGYAEQIIDYIPEGLGFLVNYKTNYNNKWDFSSVSNAESLKSMKLTDILNGTKNVKLSDFEDTEKLEDVEVYLGKSKIATTALASSRTSTANLIKAFDGEKLDYKDVEISFIVVTTDSLTLKNIAAITSESKPNPDPTDTEHPVLPVDTDRNPDEDSTPVDNIDPDNYGTGNEDDDDYDVVKTDKKRFDLALQKFVTALNDQKVTDREPVISVKDGKINYSKPNSNALNVGNGDIVEYTIRVYNEGDIDGFAKEIEDDIPTGLTFLPENETNKQYGWKMYDKSGNETTDVNQAVKVKTTYLSKENSEDNLLKAFDGSTLDCRDVKLVFAINEKAIERTKTTAKRTLINTAEITENTDKDGKDIPDDDSTPGDGRLDDGQDDIDQEKVYVKYFDLCLEKKLEKAIVTTNGEKTEVNGEGLKIEINKKNINSTSIQFVYTIKVTNEGEIEGYATEVTDYIPEGLSFDASINKDWTKVSDTIIKTESLAKTLLKPGESAEVQVTLDWVRNSDNIGRFVNVAEISEDWNPYDSDDVDSIPNNLISTEDDQDEAPVWVGIVTGLGDQPYIILPTVALIILATGVILIKKYVL